nr:basic helix-loop-helix transcription factor [Loropetalum chinense var. rubrum]
MELPQPRPFGTEGRKPTHDFLSLYNHAPVQQDPRPSHGGSYLKTHDFLQPLERVGTSSAKEENTVELIAVEKPPPPTPPPPPPPSVEHILPGGIGTYSISHISYFNQRVPKPEGTIFTVAQASSTDRNDSNSNCSSHTGSGFTLWEESVVKKGKTGKENAGERPIVREHSVKLGQWTSDRLSQASSNHRSSFSSLNSFQPSTQKNQSFMDMIKSAKGTLDDEEDDEEEFILKKEASSHKGELTVKVDGKSNDHKANTPRSKHSATEQRRRSKINDRFQMLRELIPHSDQKRDKASFLLEVIEYIQFLQEKVHKYEGSYQGWNHEPTKLIPWKNNHRPAENIVDQSQGINSESGPALMFAAKFDENNVAISPTIPRVVQNPVESDMSIATTFKAMDHPPGVTNKAVLRPMSLQPTIFSPVGTGGAAAQLSSRLASDAENTASQPQSQIWQSRSCTTGSALATDKLKEQDLSIEGGTISISSVYSQGLLNTLTQALQTSGVDLSQASISVQIDIGKRANSRLPTPTSTLKDNETPSSNQAVARRSIEDSGQAQKRLKTGKN